MPSTQDLLTWFKDGLPRFEREVGGLSGFNKSLLKNPFYVEAQALGPALLPVLALDRLSHHWHFTRLYEEAAQHDPRLCMGDDWWHHLRTSPALDDLFLGAFVYAMGDHLPFTVPQLWQYRADSFPTRFASHPGTSCLWVNDSQVYEAENATADLVLAVAIQLGRLLPRDPDLTLEQRRARASFPGVTMRPPLTRHGLEFWLPQNLGHILFNTQTLDLNISVLPLGLDHCTVFDLHRPTAYAHLLED